MITTTTIRIDKITYDKLCQIATKENRSINQQICNIIKEYIEVNKWKK